MSSKRALYEIIHDIVSHLDAGLPEVSVDAAEIADSLGTVDDSVVQKAVDQVCLANGLAASKDAATNTWRFRQASS